MIIANIYYDENLVIEFDHFCSRDLKAAMPNIILQVKTDIKTTLQEINAADLSPELEALLEGQIVDVTDTKHKIRYLVSEYEIKFINSTFFVMNECDFRFAN